MVDGTASRGFNQVDTLEIGKLDVDVNRQPRGGVFPELGKGLIFRSSD